MQHGKTKKTLIVLLLTFVLLFQTTGTFVAGQPSYADSSEPPVEIEMLRTENSKTYQLSDGSYQYVGFADDVHYRDDSGSFVEINNALKEHTTKNGYRYVNSSNSWHVSFSEDISRENAVLVESGDKSVSFCLVGNYEKAVAQLATAISGEKDDYYKEIGEDDRAIMYREAMPSVDIAYTAQSGSVKEDIVLKSKGSPRTFVFQFSAIGLKPIQDDGSILLLDHAGKEFFRIENPFMTDANGKYSDAVNMSLEDTENGFTLTVFADDSFLDAPDTAFPVVIDPSVMITGSSKTYDTCVDEQYPSSNYYTSHNLWTGGKTGTNTMRTYMKFTLPTNISASQITRATLRIKKREYATPGIRAYRVTQNWTSSAVTWNNKPSYTTSGGTSACTLDSGSWYKIDATAMVKSWIQGTYSNYGFLLKEPSETNTNQKTKWYSSDAPSPNKPELVIDYTAYSLNTVSVRKITDKTYRDEYPSYTTKINTYLSEIATPFQSRWNIEFSHYSWVSNTSLPASNCTLANNERCCDHTDVCGSTCQNNTNTSNHHKNHYRNFYLLYNNGQGSADITIGFFGFRPCSAGGLTIRSQWLSTVCQPKLSNWSDGYNRRTLQHEISHLFGCRDGVCSAGEQCIMSGGFDNVASMNQSNIWCTQCASDFNRLTH